MGGKMKDEYIIINRTAIQKRIEELEEELQNLENLERKYRDKSWDEQYAILPEQIGLLKTILSQSAPLIPVVENAFDAGRTVKNYKGEWKETFSDVMTSAKYEESKDYIKNLKLDL